MNLLPHCTFSASVTSPLAVGGGSARMGGGLSNLPLTVISSEVEKFLMDKKIRVLCLGFHSSHQGHLAHYKALPYVVFRGNLVITCHSPEADIASLLDEEIRLSPEATQLAKGKGSWNATPPSPLPCSHGHSITVTASSGKQGTDLCVFTVVWSLVLGRPHQAEGCSH